MRRTLLILAGFASMTAWSLGATSVAHADPYKWCAQYSGGAAGGGTNCGFVTLEQCRATVSGIGGFCTENLFYDGVPFDRQPAPRRRNR
jgi:hypothetical protein